MADLVVLAIAAVEVARGKEDRACTPRAGQRRFFAMVRHGAVQQEPVGKAAKAGFSRPPVHIALPRAKGAMI